MKAQTAYYTEEFINTINYLADLDVRCNKLLNTDNWVAKLTTVTAATALTPFIDQLLKDGNTTIWLPYRKDIYKQFMSFVNAGYRQNVLMERPGGFVYKNSDTKYSRYTEIDTTPQRVCGQLKTMVTLTTHWRHIYDVYKDKVNLVCYEDHIVTNDLTKFGIAKESVSEYNARNDRMIPTPNNSYRFTDNTIWPMCVRVLNRYKHLVEI